MTDPSFIHQTVDLTAFDLSAFWGGPATLSFDIIDVDWWVNSGLALDNIHVASGGAAPPVPEPATIILLGSGLVGIAIGRKREALRKLLWLSGSSSICVVIGRLNSIDWGASFLCRTTPCLCVQVTFSSFIV